MFDGWRREVNTGAAESFATEVYEGMEGVQRAGEAGAGEGQTASATAKGTQKSDKTTQDGWSRWTIKGGKSLLTDSECIRGAGVGRGAVQCVLVCAVGRNVFSPAVMRRAGLGRPSEELRPLPARPDRAHARPRAH